MLRKKYLLILILAILTTNTFSQVYLFNGNGNWSVPGNWQNNIIPPAILPAGDTIYISPPPGDSCVLDISQQVISEGAFLSVTDGANFIVPGVLVIRGGYPSVTICGQGWMKRNLDVVTYRNGDTIPQVTTIAEWTRLATGAWCYYNNDPANDSVYGKLYNWYAVNDPRGLAPEGWHIPAYAEWMTLKTCLNASDIPGGNESAGSRLKEPGTLHWLSPNNFPSSFTPTGFNALPGGIVTESPSSTGWQWWGMRSSGWWWCADLANNGDPYGCYMRNDVPALFFGSGSRLEGMSVRCIKNTIPVLTTKIPNDISPNHAYSGANITSDGGDNIIAKGVVWSTNPGPEISLSTKTNDGTGANSFTSNITGLELNTVYYVRAYATNNTGTAYGNEVSFTTLASANPPFVQTTQPIYSSSTGMWMCGGDIYNDGGSPVIQRGVLWSTTPNPDFGNAQYSSDGAGTGSFVSYIVGLQPLTTYYVRAYASNSVAVALGQVFSFTTQ